MSSFAVRRTLKGDKHWSKLSEHERSVWLNASGGNDGVSRDAAWRAHQHGHGDKLGCLDCVRHARRNFNDGHYVR